MAENELPPAGSESGGGVLTRLMPAALALFLLAMACFGGLSYGAYSFGATWKGLGFFAGLIAVFAAAVVGLRRFFGKFNGRLMFALWLISILGAYFVFLFENNKYPMGIDLAGGTELIYRLDYSQADRAIASLERELKIKEGEDPNSKDTLELRNQVYTMQEAKKGAPDKAADVVRRRIDPTGTKGIPVTTYGRDKERLRIQLPRATTEEVKRIKTAIETQGRLTFHIVASEQSEREVVTKTRDSQTKTWTDPKTGIEYEEKILRKPRPYSTTGATDDEPIVMQRAPGMDGSKITLAMARRDQETAGFEISVRFNQEGQRQFGDLTSKNIKKQMAIVLDGIIYSAPVIQSAIYGECRITGNFTKEEAERLAGVLTAGSLPAEVKVENEFTVGPALGREQIASGTQATMIGTILVICFMLLYYRLSGALAAFCTGLNILMLMGAMGFFKATLTLPGIAGIVLTLGMSMDANVLILERLREEFQRGRPLRLAVAHGFDRAFLTIVDCNMTTLISGIVLYYLGTGPVRGFAVTLSIGILTTLFCNLWLNWVIMEWLVSRASFARLNMMQMFKTPTFDYMKYRKFWMAFTGALVAASLALIVLVADRYYDVDFKGGTLIQFNFAPGKAKPAQQVKDILETQVKAGVKERVPELVAKIETGDLGLTTQTFGEPEQEGGYRRFTVTTGVSDENIIAALLAQIRQTFKDDLEAAPVVSQEDGILVRFEESEKPDKVKEAIKKQQVEWARESANQDIKDALLALDVATTEKAGGYLNVTLAPVRGDAKAKEKVFAVVETARIEGRAGGAISRQTTFGAQVAGEMWRDAIIALIIANLGIFMYLWFRFEFSGGWGFGAIMAVIHDASVAAGAVIVANLLGWPILIDLNTVAALLTIIGFSVNDTVVIFDRIREVKAAHPTRTYEDIVNEAVNATLGRTVLTTTTVLLANISLLVFGGPTIRGLAFTLLIGFIVGTYSTVFIASPLMIWWYRRFGSGQAPLPTRTTRPTEEAAAGAEV